MGELIVSILKAFQVRRQRWTWTCPPGEPCVVTDRGGFAPPEDLPRGTQNAIATPDQGWL